MLWAATQTKLTRLQSGRTTESSPAWSIPDAHLLRIRNAECRERNEKKHFLAPAACAQLLLLERSALEQPYDVTSTPSRGATTLLVAKRHLERVWTFGVQHHAIKSRQGLKPNIYKAFGSTEPCYMFRWRIEFQVSYTLFNLGDAEHPEEY